MYLPSLVMVIPRGRPPQTIVRVVVRGDVGVAIEREHLGARGRVGVEIERVASEAVAIGCEQQHFVVGLRELERNGVVRRRTLPPPGAAAVYELTGYGRELEPVLLALGRWGAKSLGVPGPEQSLRSGWIGVAMRARDYRDELVT